MQMRLSATLCLNERGSNLKSPIVGEKLENSLIRNLRKGLLVGPRPLVLGPANRIASLGAPAWTSTFTSVPWKIYCIVCEGCEPHVNIGCNHTLSPLCRNAVMPATSLENSSRTKDQSSRNPTMYVLYYIVSTRQLDIAKHLQVWHSLAFDGVVRRERGFGTSSKRLV